MFLHIFKESSEKKVLVFAIPLGDAVGADQL